MIINQEQQKSYQLTVTNMKNRKASHTKNQKQLNIESKAKIYVPISVSQNNNTTLSVQENNSNNDHVVSELKKANLELKQKQEIYIDKLIKLEEGLEKQHIEFMQLQDLYNELFASYKHKQEQISQLEQKYRDSNRKKQNIMHQANTNPAQKSLETQLRKQIIENKQINDKKEHELAELNKKVNDLQRVIEKLTAQNLYFKNKDKMNDSRASLNSKVFEQLGQWQRQADTQKQQKIKLQYENKYLRSRNQDLQSRINQLEDIISQKQQEMLKLRQSNITLSRENSQNRLLRSTSRSPRKNKSGENSERKETIAKKSTAVQQLYSQNKQLKKQLQKFKNRNIDYLKSPQKNQYFIRQEQFYSFSQQDPSNHSSNQQNQKIIHKQLFIKVQNDYEIEGSNKRQYIIKKVQQISQQKDNGRERGEYQSLQQLPTQLEIQKLIERSKKKEMLDF